MKTNPLLLIITIGIIFAALLTPSRAQSSGAALVLTAKGPVTPVMLSYIQRGIEAAETQQAEIIIIKLNTPGGQIDLTREIIQSIINANVPVAVYVYPSGGFAASAGTFITLSAHVAAMAPQTSIGAASPVDAQGGDIEETLRAKLNNILVADMKNLAERRGEKAVEWATQAITEAKAAGAGEAMKLGIIDFIAGDVPDLLQQMDGFEVSVHGQAKTLRTANAPVVDFTPTFAEGILAIILRPEIAFLLMTIGTLAIIYELATPGGYIGGVIGVISLVVGLYALGQLPINFAGAALVLLALILFVAEVFTPTHGALTLAGVISLALGGLLLFNETKLGYQVSVAPILATALFVGLFFFFIVGKAIGALKMKPASGAEGLIGATAIVRTPLNPKGTVFTDGTLWNAELENGEPAAVGELVEIVKIKGLQLTVQRKAPTKKEA